MNGLAHKIRYARRNKNLSQKRLGKKLGLSEMAVSAYETGRAIPPWPTLKKISQLTDFPLAYFAEEKTEGDSLADLVKEVSEIRRDLSKILKLLSKKPQ